MFHKQNARQPWAAVLLALLLALASAFSCIGLSGWASFRRQLAALDAQYTTVAYAISDVIPTRYDYRPVEQYDDGSLVYEDGNVWFSPQRVNALAEQAPGLLGRESNILAAAYTPGLKGMSSGAADPLTYADVYDEGRYAQSVAAMRCLSVEKNPDFDRAPFNLGYYLIWFEWIDPVCRMDAYDLPEHSRVIQFYYALGLDMDENGEPQAPFEAGKTYLLRGTFKDFGNMYWFKSKEEGYCWFRYTQDYVRSIFEDANQSYNDPALNPTRYRNESPWQRFSIELPLRGEDGSSLSKDMIGCPYPLISNFYLDYKPLPEEKTRGYITRVPEESWPLYAEYEGDWRDFLETEEGRVWREEYDAGAPVCLVGADYALYNGLQVGDTITLDLYKPSYFTVAGGVSFGPQPSRFYYTCCMPLAEENRLGAEREYTIVGLYSTPTRPCDPDGHSFRGDTVLAPKGSAPEVLAAGEEDRVTPLLNTLVLKNGSIEEFEAYMAENGAANRFRYHDYGYSEMRSSVEAMEGSALRLAALGGAAFLVGGAVFLLAGFGRMLPAARGLRLLGAGPRRVAGEMLCALLPLMAAGVLAGGGLGGLLYGKVCEAVLSQSLAPDWPGLAACALIQLAALGAVAAVWAALTARRGLMRRKLG